MKFTAEDYDAYYRTIYTSNVREKPSVIIYGTLVQMLDDFYYGNKLIVCICFIPDLLFTYLPLLTKRLIKNSKKTYVPEKNSERTICSYQP